MKNRLTQLLFGLLLIFTVSCKKPNQPRITKSGDLTIKTYKINGSRYNIIVYKDHEFLQTHRGLEKIK